MTYIGHEQAWDSWTRATKGQRMHHAWLLAGKKGLGKAGFAQAAARRLLGAGTELHPDILSLTYGAKDDKEERKRADGKAYESARSIRIAQVRAMQRRLTTKPTLGDRRIVIIDAADDLERNAANALLKSLEEPPQGTTFLLITHRPARLLPTIRSRCRTLRFPSLSDQVMDELLRDLAPDAEAETRTAAVKAAAGSPGAAISFVRMDLGEAATLMSSILKEGDRGFALRGALAGVIGARPDRDRLQAVLDLARSTLAEEVEQASRDPSPLIDAHGELVRLTAEQPIFNYDAGLLAMEIGTLLAKAGAASASVDA
ncbi:AAA family ATPase [Erythrobacter litoralis]|uniref:AAA family ATPase n=1 Tax=Erythrobacter litoralis TaxID=39960 RepID=UPI002434B51A|nr:AAA family ATPase [Erythrobacter litoralis]MDG6078184.1 AAA family ATPase [Erythrobacter litoralis]